MDPPPDDYPPFTITVGPVTFDCAGRRMTTRINKSDHASGTVSADDIATSRADWLAPAAVAIGGDVLTRGEVVEAVPHEDGSVALSVESARQLSESRMPPMVVQQLTPAEVVYAAARTAGFAAKDTRIRGLDDLPVEPMWVLAPVSGVRVERPARVGVVEFLDGAEGREMLRRFDPPLDPYFSEPLNESSAFARVPVAQRLLYEAEEEGLALIDAAAAWLTARFRYSWSHLPDGCLQHYRREATRAAVERRDGVGVLAVEGPRRWWRGTTVERAAGEVALRPDAPWTEPALPAELAPGDRQAMLALQRAATAGDPVQRVTALFEAVEFYVGRRGPGKLFERPEIKTVVKCAREGLEGAQADRVETVLRQFLNQFSLRARLEHVLDDESVPRAPEDLALLWELRQERNEAVHGGDAAPRHEDIDRAVAFMSRAIATRWHRARE